MPTTGSTCGRRHHHLARRALVAIAVAVAFAAGIRVRGSGGIPPQTGGWRELRRRSSLMARILLFGAGASGTDRSPASIERCGGRTGDP